MSDHDRDPTGRTDRGNQNDEDLGSSATRGGGNENIDKDKFGDQSRTQGGRSGSQSGQPGYVDDRSREEQEREERDERERGSSGNGGQR